MMVLAGRDMVKCAMVGNICHKNKEISVKWFGILWECRLGCSGIYREFADIEICKIRIFRG